MSNKEEDVLLDDHNYDGIQEYDNPMPKWWINIFIGSVVFSVLYFVHYEFGHGQGIHEVYADEVAAFEAYESERRSTTVAATEATLTQAASDTKLLAEGKQVYTTNCLACHGAQGEGVIGPNLTDAFWIHGDGTLMGIYKTVSEGVLEKGMPAWSRVLAPDQMQAVVGFLGSIRNTDVKGKAPEGEQKSPP